MALMSLFGTRDTRPVTLPDTALRPKGDSYVRIDGHDYPLRAWNLTGFTASPYNGSLITKHRAKVEMVVRDIADPEGGLRLDGTVVVTHAGDGRLEARWTGLPTYKSRLLTAYFTQKVNVQH